MPVESTKRPIRAASPAPEESLSTAHRPSPRRPRRSPWIWIGLGFAATAALGGVGLTAASIVVRGEVAERLVRLGERHGAHITWSSIELEVSGLVLVERLRIEGHGASAELARLEARIAPTAALGGQRHPDSVRIVGGRVAVDVAELLAGRESGDGGDVLGRGGRRAFPIVVQDLELELRAQGLAAPLRLGQVSARVEPGSPGSPGEPTATVLTLGGAADLPGGQRRLEARVRLGAEPSLAARWSGPVGLSMSLEGHPLRAQARGLERAGGRTVLLSAALAMGGTHLGCERLELVDGGGLVPDPARIEEALCVDATLLQGSRRVGAERVAVELTAPPEGTLALPTPRSIRLEGIRTELRGGQLALGAREVVAELHPRALERVREHSPLGAIAALSIADPSIHWITQGALGSVARVAGAEQAVSSESALPLPGTGALTLPGAAVRAVRDLELTIEHGRVRVDTPERPRALILDDVVLSLTPSESGGLSAEVEALIVDKSGRAGRISSVASVGADGGIRAAEGVLEGTSFAHVLSRTSEYVTVAPEAWVRIGYDYHFDATPSPVHRAEAEVRFEDFGFEAWRVSHTPVAGLEGRVDVDATWRPGTWDLDLELEDVRIGEARLSASLGVTAPPEARPSIRAKVAIPEQDCGAIARSIPRAMLPRLVGLTARGKLSLEGSLAVDLDDPYGLELDVDGDLARCEVLELGGDIDLERLLARGFVHHPIEPERGRLEHIALGPGTRQWMPSHLIPDFVKAGAVVTEDRGFYAHGGVRWKLVGRALRLNLHKGRFVYGGSTITQQLVKNLFLTREKTLARKLEELIITWQVERTLTKDEILTLYLNVIEYGPDLYGLKAASRHYFAKEVWALSPKEAAFLMGLKPWPKQGHKQWERQELNSWWLRRVEHVMGMMFRRERAITEAELLAAAPYTVRFRKPDEPLWSDRRYVPPSPPGP